MFVIKAADDQRKGFPHRRDIGRDVGCVGSDQKKNKRQDQPARRQLHHIGSEALAGHSADPRTDQLDCDHEWGCQKHRPKQAVAKLRPGLRIGGNARRIVIGRAGHQSWPEQPKNHVCGFFDLCAISFGHEIL